SWFRPRKRPPLLSGPLLPDGGAPQGPLFKTIIEDRSSCQILKCVYISSHRGIIRDRASFRKTIYMPEISKDQIKALVAARIDPEKTVISDIIIDKADVY